MRTLMLAILAGVTFSGCIGSKDPTDEDGDGYAFEEDCDDADAAISPGATEACDEVDNDCDGDIDEAGADGEATTYADADGDGYGDAAAGTTACTAPDGNVEDATDCDDTTDAVSPALVEVCDDADVDEDCSGAADDADSAVSDASTWYADADGDTYGDAQTISTACDQPSGTVADATDCDDIVATNNPAGTEACDGVDNDCDTEIDEPGATGESTFYMDGDGDTYGDATTTVTACQAGAGIVADATDCDDENATVHPASAEICDSVDNDCDTLVDGDDDSVTGLNTYYADFDGDGYGYGGVSEESCTQPLGYVVDSTDCDDADAAVNTGASEVCDDLDTDEDCDNLVDDDDASVTGLTTWYIDSDGDGGGDNDTSVQSCAQPVGYVDNASDPYEDASFADFSSDADLEEATDVIYGSSALYAVGFNSDGDPSVVSIDPSSGTVTEIYAGDPLAQPSGIALSADGMTLYVADVGSETTLGETSGGVFEIPVAGGSATEIGVEGTIDMPGDVTLSLDGATAYVSGIGTGGSATIFSVDVATGATTTAFEGDPLVDPLALDVSPDGATLYVVDSLAADGTGALLVFDIAGWTYDDELGWDIDLVFPGGLAADDAGSTLLVTEIGALSSIATDGSGLQTLDVASALEFPIGVTLSGESAYVTDISDDATSDIYLFTY